MRNPTIEWGLALVLIGIRLGSCEIKAAEGSVVMTISNDVVLLKVDGDKDDDWWLQTSTNLSSWTIMTSLGPLLSGNETNAVWRSTGGKVNGAVYYRALQTAGLYDPTLFRTISLTYTQADAAAFSNDLHFARAFGTNIYLPMVWLDNGATNRHVGARFKGFTSYDGEPFPPLRKSINLELDFIGTNANLMNYSTVNLNNAHGDETVMREPLFFNVMSQYVPCPRGALCQLYANGSLWSVYSLIQQENGELINEWFPSNDGDRWLAPNNPNTLYQSAFGYLGNTNIATYLPYYILKTNNSTTNDAYSRLINAIYVLNNTAGNLLRDKAEDVFAVDSWLWFLAIENICVDDDSYWSKGADYGFYWEIESGRIHPVEHDGNESFAQTFFPIFINFTLDPLTGASDPGRPLLYRFLSINELLQRYLAHMRTVLAETFNPAVLTPKIDSFHRLSVSAIMADPLKGITMDQYTNDLIALKTYITNRYNYLMSHSQLTPLPPNINAVSGPTGLVFATNTPYITATATANGSSGIGSVWLYHRGKSYGHFTRAQMFDDGLHGDGPAGDGVFGAATTSYPAGSKVRYYIEVRSTDGPQTAGFSPARAENETYTYHVATTPAPSSPVVLNEFMASNTSTIADPQGEYDDWIELRNLTGEPVSLTGRYLSDEPDNPRKWRFPDGTTIPANGYLIVWADEDTSATSGLHASFKISAGGEELFLTDTDADLNQVLDHISFGVQSPDVAFGRTLANPDAWATMPPTPGAANK